MGRFNVVDKLNRYGMTGTAALAGHGFRYFLHKHVLRRRYLTRRIHDYQMSLDLSDPGLSTDIAIRGTREHQLRWILQQTLESGHAVLDLGANIGFYALMMARLVGPEGRVFALEPERRNFDLLRKNIALNDLGERIEAFQLAGSDRTGSSSFFLSEYSNLHSFIPVSEGGNSIEVETTDLSTFLEGKPPIDLLRMDIEGFEVEVLKGLQPAVEEGRFGGAIVFECHSPRYTDQHSMVEPLEWLFERGYRAAWLTSSHEGNRSLREHGYEPERVIAFDDRRSRGVYPDISHRDAINLICEVGGVRDVVLLKGR